MKTYILKQQTINIKSEEIISSTILGVYATMELAETRRAYKVYKAKKQHDTDSVCIMSGGAQMVATDTFGYIYSIEEKAVEGLDDEMDVWKARANDEFGKTLKEIEKASMNYFGCDEDEYGIRSTPLSYPITAYSLDGNRKHTANVIIATLEEWDILEDDSIKAMADKLNKLAA